MDASAGAFVRLWGSTGILSDLHLREMRTAVERVVAASASAQ
jgi:hypothetical protein